jgi:hypothetical protein
VSVTAWPGAVREGAFVAFTGRQPGANQAGATISPPRTLDLDPVRASATSPIGLSHRVPSRLPSIRLNGLHIGWMQTKGEDCHPA